MKKIINKIGLLTTVSTVSLAAIFVSVSCSSVNNYSEEQIKGFYNLFEDKKTLDANIDPATINAKNLNKVYAIPNGMPSDIEIIFKNFKTSLDKTSLFFSVELMQNDKLLGNAKTIIIKGFVSKPEQHFTDQQIQDFYNKFQDQTTSNPNIDPTLINETNLNTVYQIPLDIPSNIQIKYSSFNLSENKIELSFVVELIQNDKLLGNAKTIIIKGFVSKPEQHFTDQQIQDFYNKFQDQTTSNPNIDPTLINETNLNTVYQIPSNLPKDVTYELNNFTATNNSTNLSFSVQLKYNNELLGLAKTIIISGFVPKPEQHFTEQEIKSFYDKFDDRLTLNSEINPNTINKNNLSTVYQIPSNFPEDVTYVFNNFNVTNNSTALSFSIQLKYNNQLLGKEKTIIISGFKQQDEKPIIPNSSTNFLTPQNQEELTLLGNKHFVLRKRFHKELMPYLINKNNYLNYLIFSNDCANYFETNKYRVNSTSFDLFNGILTLKLTSFETNNPPEPISIQISDFFGVKYIDNTKDNSEIFLAMFKMDKWYKQANSKYYTNEKVFNKQFKLRPYFEDIVTVIPYNNDTFALSGEGTLKIKIKLIANNEERMINLNGFSSNEESVPIVSVDVEWNKTFNPIDIRNKGVNDFVQNNLLKENGVALNDGKKIFDNFQKYFKFKNLPYAVLGQPVEWEFIKVNNNDWFKINSDKGLSASVKGTYGNNNLTLLLNYVYPLNFINPNLEQVKVLDVIGFKEKNSNYVIGELTKDNFLNYFELTSSYFSAEQLKNNFITIDQLKLKNTNGTDPYLEVKVSLKSQNRLVSQREYFIGGLKMPKFDKSTISIDKSIDANSTSAPSQVKNKFSEIGTDTEQAPAFYLKHVYDVETGHTSADYYNAIDATNVNEHNFGDIIDKISQNNKNMFFNSLNANYYVVYKDVIKRNDDLFSFKMILVDRTNPKLFYSDKKDHYCKTTRSKLKSYQEIYQKFNTEISFNRKSGTDIASKTVYEVFQNNNIENYFEVINSFANTTNGSNIEIKISPSKETTGIFAGTPFWYSDASKGEIYVKLLATDKNTGFSAESETYYVLDGFKTSSQDIYLDIGGNRTNHSIKDLLASKKNVYIHNSFNDNWKIKQNVQTHFNDNNWKLNKKENIIVYQKNFAEFKNLIGSKTEVVNVFLGYEINEQNFKINDPDAAIGDKKVSFTIDFKNAIEKINNGETYVVKGVLNHNKNTANAEFDMTVKLSQDKQNIILKISVNNSLEFHNTFDFSQNNYKAILAAVPTIRMERILTTKQLNWKTEILSDFDYANSDGIIGGNRQSITLKEVFDKNDPWKSIQTKNLSYFAPDQFALNKGFVHPYSEITKSSVFSMVNRLAKRVICGNGTLTMISKVKPSDDNDYRYYLITNEHVAGTSGYLSPPKGFAIPPISNTDIDGHNFPNIDNYSAQVFWSAREVANRMGFKNNNNQVITSNEDIAILILDIKPILDVASGVGQNNNNPDYEVYNYLSNWKNLPPLKFGSGFDEFISNEADINQGILEIGYPDENFNIRKTNTVELSYMGSGATSSATNIIYGSMNTQLNTSSISALPLYIFKGASGSVALNENQEIIGLHATGQFNKRTIGNIKLVSSAFVDYIGSPRNYSPDYKTGTFYEKLLEATQREPNKFELIDVFSK